MRKIFGLDVFPPPKTDHEFVAEARSRLEKSQRMGKWLIMIGIIRAATYIAMAAIVWNAIANVAARIGINAGGIWAGIGMGLPIGMIVGACVLYAHRAVAETVSVVHDERTSRLMVKYYDAVVTFIGEGRSSDAPVAIGGSDEAARI